MNRLRSALLAVALAMAAGSPRADTVQASSTSMLLVRQDWREGALQTAVPLYELLNIDASDVRTPYADFEVALSTWGAIDLADVRFWQNGARTDTRFTGDVNVGFIRGELLSHRLRLTVGRQLISEGISRMVQIDGAEARVALPAGFALSGYAGSPVSPRFATRGGDFAAGNLRATFTTGGRASWSRPGLLDVGASLAMATDHGDPSRQDFGADFRLTPHRLVQLTGTTWWSLYEGRLGEASFAAMLFPVAHLDVTLDYRHVLPDLFLPRNSILSVFVSEKRNDVGGALHYDGVRDLALDADYHLLIQDVGQGHWARARGTYSLRGGPATTAGAELSLLSNAGTATSLNGNGYKELRLFGSRRMAQAFLSTLDLMSWFYENPVNGQKRSLAATATVGYELGRGWRATVAGTAGSTPYLERQFEVMAKLVYQQTYAVREVK